VIVLNTINRTQDEDEVTGSVAFQGYVITLVHGTWGRGLFGPSGDAAWTTKGSTLRDTLQDRLGKNAIFRRFRWSGRNNHTGRAKAAKDLRNYLEHGLEQWPAATHVVIAHSHGGNVALYAMKDTSLLERVAGIACLSTPFISVRKRDLGPDQIRTLALALVAVVVAIPWLLQKVFLSSWTDWERVGISALVLPVLLGTFAFFRPAERQAEKLRHELTPAAPGAGQLLILRSPADEAYGALSVFQFISQVSVRLFFLAQSCRASFEALTVRWASQKRKVVMVGGGALVLCATLLVCFVSLTSDGSRSLLANGVLAGAVISFLAFAGAIFLITPGLGAEGVSLPVALITSVLLWPLLAILSALLILPFGWQAAVSNLFLDVFVDTTPVGSWEIHLIDPPASEQLGVPIPSLGHTIYENPYALNKLGEWISQRRTQ
jgi:hypothetical protein